MEYILLIYLFCYICRAINNKWIMKRNAKAALIAAATLIALLGFICLLVWFPIQTLLPFVVVLLYVCLYRLVILLMDNWKENRKSEQ